MNLLERLQTELVGEAPIGKCTGIDCPGCDHARLQTRAKATASHIEADLKGLLPFKEHSVTCAVVIPEGAPQADPSVTCNCGADAFYDGVMAYAAAIERYCRNNEGEINEITPKP